MVHNDNDLQRKDHGMYVHDTVVLEAVNLSGTDVIKNQSVLRGIGTALKCKNSRYLGGAQL